MKRKRAANTEGGEICELGSEWASKRRTPSSDKKGFSTLGYKFMSSRPSARKSRLGFPTAANYLANGSDFTRGSDRHPDQYSKVEDEDDGEGDWISQLGAQYMTRKKLYASRGPLSDCSAHFSPREHELELDNELDNSWIADYGMQWMRRRLRTRRGQYKVHDDAWVCELGYQWMSRVRERERSNQTWLSDLSSQYMTRRQREINHNEEFGSGHRGILQATRDHNDSYESISPWETRRKLQYSEPEPELNHTDSINGHGAHFSAGEELRPADTQEEDALVNDLKASDSLPRQDADVNSSTHAEQQAKLKDDADNSGRGSHLVDSVQGFNDKDEVEASDGFQVLEFDTLGDLESALYVNLDDTSSSS